MKYTLVYRGGEFEAEIEARNAEEAIEKFKNEIVKSKRDMQVCGKHILKSIQRMVKKQS